MKGLGRRVAPIAFGKLVLHPLAVTCWLAVLLFAGISRPGDALLAAAVLSAAMPMFSIYPTFAQAYGEEAIAAPALLVTTLASFGTLSVLLWAVRHHLTAT